MFAVVSSVDSTWGSIPKIGNIQKLELQMLGILEGKLIGKLLSAIWPKQTIFPFLVFYFNTVKLCET